MMCFYHTVVLNFSFYFKRSHLFPSLIALTCVMDCNYRPQEQNKTFKWEEWVFDWRLVFFRCTPDHICPGALCDVAPLAPRCPPHMRTRTYCRPRSSKYWHFSLLIRCYLYRVRVGTCLFPKVWEVLIFNEVLTEIWFPIWGRVSNILWFFFFRLWRKPISRF